VFGSGIYKAEHIQADLLASLWQGEGRPNDDMGRVHLYRSSTLRRGNTMSTVSHENGLAEHHYATLILRLMLDQHGRLMYGDIVDVANTHQEHFVGDHGLIQAVRTWLSQHEQDYANIDPPLQ